MKRIIFLVLCMIATLGRASSGWTYNQDEGYRFQKTVSYVLADDESGDVSGDGSYAKVGKSNAAGESKITIAYYDSQAKLCTATVVCKTDGYNQWQMVGDRYIGIGFDGEAYLFLYVEDKTGTSVFHMYVPSQKTTNIPSEWQKARTLLGVYGDMCGDNYEGTVQVKCSKANKKGMAKVSMTITPFSGKKITYKSVSVDVTSGGEIRVEWSSEKYYVSIDGDEFFGEPIYDGARPTCMPHAVWSADIGGKIADGEYVFASEYAYRFWDQDEDWEIGFCNTFTGGRYCLNLALSMPFLSGQSFSVKNGKMNFGKKPTLKYKMIGGRPVLTGLDDSKPNIPATTLTYNEKTGVFKGSCVLYTDPHVCIDDNTRILPLKKYTFQVTGVIMTGAIVGRGVATCKQPAFSCPVVLYGARVAW